MRAVPEPVADEVLHDLRQRLKATRRVGLPRGLRWDRGVDPDYLTSLLEYWAEEYDWRKHEVRIHALPWALIEADGFASRAIHQRSGQDHAAAVVLLHGWPDSVLRFERVLPLLEDLHVVVPCLPGFPYSAPVLEPGMSVTVMAEVVARVMSELGYERYVVSGGDVGSGVAESLAAAHPDRVGALHLTDMPFRRASRLDPSSLSPEEQEYLAAAQRWQRSEGGYMHEQATKPHTLSVGLGDSPAGLAAWIVEKLRAWSDCGGDVESVFSREELLTWITAYWVTGTIGTSFLPYVERPEIVERVEAPSVFTLFPHDLVRPPRVLGERLFHVCAWEEHPDGGHFAAWERPERFVAGLRLAVDLL
jgi:pimeloyl-ACP methyl ester carboxylesterase